MFISRNKFRLCEVFGIPIDLDASLAILLLFFLLSGGPVEQGFLCALMLLFSIVFHELAHSLTARAFGYRTRNITLSLLGGCASLISLPRKNSQMTLTALAGPVASLALSIVAMALLGFIASAGGIADAACEVAASVLDSFGLHINVDTTLRFSRQTIIFAHALFYLSSINLMLALFNMLPGFPMDGGRVLLGVLRQFTSRVKATYTAMIVGRVTAVLIGLRGIWVLVNGEFWGAVSIMIAWMIWRTGWIEYMIAKQEEDESCGWRPWRAFISPPPYGGDSDECDVRRDR